MTEFAYDFTGTSISDAINVTEQVRRKIASIQATTKESKAALAMLQELNQALVEYTYQQVLIEKQKAIKESSNNG